MRRYLADVGRARLTSHSDGTRSAKLVVEATALQSLIVELLLILRGLADVLRLATDGVEFLIRQSPRDFGEGSISGQHVDVAMSARQLDAVIEFLLVYFRDGMASVPHLDVEVDATDRAGAITFVVEAMLAVPPISGDDARRLLGE